MLRSLGLLIVCCVCCVGMTACQSSMSKEVLRVFEGTDLNPLIKTYVHQRQGINQSTGQGMRVSYVTLPQPNKPTVLFIHGSPGRWSMYRSYLKDSMLAADFQLISVTRPGYGDQDSLWEAPSGAHLAWQSEAIGNMLRAYGATTPIIAVGHSYGGPLAVRLAIDFPELVQALFLSAPILDPELEQRAWWRHLLRSAYAEPVVPFRWRMSNIEIMALKEDLSAMLPGYAKLCLPVYYMHGTYDILVPFENASFVQRMMKNCDLKMDTLKKVNHFLPWTHRQKFKEAIYYLRDKL